jgi:hypothetical protein
LARVVVGTGFGFPSRLPRLEDLDSLRVVNVSSLPGRVSGGVTYVLTGNASGGAAHRRPPSSAASRAATWSRTP